MEAFNPLILASILIFFHAKENIEKICKAVAALVLISTLLKMFDIICVISLCLLTCCVASASLSRLCLTVISETETFLFSLLLLWMALLSITVKKGDGPFGRRCRLVLKTLCKYRGQV